MITSSFKDLPVGLGLALETIAAPTAPRLSQDRPIPPATGLEEVEFICIDLVAIAIDVIRSLQDFNKHKNDVDFIINKMHLAIESINNIPELLGIVKVINTSTYLIANSAIVKQFKEGSKNLQQRELLNKVLKLLPMNFEYEKNTFALGRNTLYFSSNNYWLSLLKNLKGNVLVLESHTGNILTEITLNKKYKKSSLYNNKELPFDSMLLKFLGDGAFIQGFKHKDIKELISFMKTNWNPTTTRESIAAYLMKEYKEQYFNLK